jgi:uncharacterized glyoxalase superfamily protein PhnB
MFSDNFPGTPFTVGNNISLTLLSKDIEELTSWFNKLKEGGKVEWSFKKPSGANAMVWLQINSESIGK